MFGKLKKLASSTSFLAEGPLWDAERQIIYYVDIPGKRLHKIDVDGVQSYVDLPMNVGCLGLKRDGSLIAGLEDGVYEVSMQGVGNMMHPKTPIKGYRFNDGKVGPDGAFYVGTMDSEGKGGFYRLSPEGELVELFDGVSISNGLDWSLDHKTMYYIDSPHKCIDAFDFNDGKLSNRRTIVTPKLEDGQVPDGMCIDSNGMLWVAIFNGSAVLQFDPTSGELIGKIDMPDQRITCCAFAGQDLKRMLITSALENKDAQTGKSSPGGSLYEIDAPIPGLLPFRFG